MVTTHKLAQHGHANMQGKWPAVKYVKAAGMECFVPGTGMGKLLLKRNLVTITVTFRLGTWEL